jgi:hypothetical protein
VSQDVASGVEKRRRYRATAETQNNARAAALARRDLESQARYLDAIERLGTVSAGCRAAHVAASTVYAWRALDETFQLSEDQARSTFADRLEEEAVRRAHDGVPRPVFQGGVLVGYEQVYSDHLLWKLLQAVRPEKYRENLQLQVTSVIKQVSGFEPSEVL